MGHTSTDRTPGTSAPEVATKAVGDAPDDYVKTGVMLALYPDEDTAQALAIADGLPHHELHVTVAYVGKTDQVDHEALLAAARIAASGRGQIAGTYSGHARFTGGDDGDALVALYDSHDLEELRRGVVAALADEGVELNTEHGYTAHTTLAYLQPGDDSPVDRLDPRPATFDRLVVVYGQERTDVPFTDDEIPVEPETKTAEQKFDRDNLPAEGWQSYRKTKPIKAVRIDGPFTVKTREGEIATPDGFLALDSAGWPYPIAAEEMAAVYEAESETKAIAPVDEDEDESPGVAGSLALPGFEVEVEVEVEVEEKGGNPFGKGGIGGGKGDDAGPKMSTGAFVALGKRKGRVDLIVTSGTVPGAKLPSGEDVEGSKDSPAARVVEYEPAGNGTFKATGKKFASSVSKLRRIPPLRTRSTKSLDEALAVAVSELGDLGDEAPSGDVLRTVHERGVKSWPGEDHTDLSADEWGLGRVDAFAATCAGMRPEGYLGDDDLLPRPAVPA